LAFDVTPHALVSAIITEVGVLKPPYGEAITRVLDQSCPPSPKIERGLG